MRQDAVLLLAVILAGALSQDAVASPQGPAVQVRLAQLPSTLRLGETVRATLVVECQQRPSTPSLPRVPGLGLRLGAPSSKRSIEIINGRRRASFSWNYGLEVSAQVVGKFKLPPIDVRIGDKVYRTRERILEVVKTVTGANFGSVAIVPSSRRVYVHEPIRFDIECAVDNKLKLASQVAQNGQQYYLVDLQAEWLSSLSGAQQLEVAGVEAGDTVQIVLNGRSLQPANVTVGQGRDGKSYYLFRCSKSFLPTRAGKRQLTAPVMKFTVQTGRRRGGFGLFNQPELREYFAYGEAVAIEVLPLPTVGRPDPYFGGVGRFSIGASLSKGRVKVGESLKLELRITGHGNTEYLQAPELGELPGFHQLGKNINRKDGEVVVTYDLMPTAASVTQVPALHWNYFDTTAGVEKYVEVASESLPLEVLPIADEASLKALPGEVRKAMELGVDDIFDLRPQATGAGTTVVAAPPGVWTIWLACLAPWALGLFGMAFARARRRRCADVHGRRARGARREFDQALVGGSDPLDAFIDYLAARLGCASAAIIETELAERLRAAGIDSTLSRQLQATVEAGVAARYSGNSASGVDRARVEAQVAALEGLSLRTPVRALLQLLCVSLSILAVAADSPGQQLGKGEAAYRAHDYNTAASEFAAAAATGDRDAAYNLGNTRYRQGRYAEALHAYERARLAMPRDPELLANLRLVRQRLELGSEEEAFAETLAVIRDSMTATERLWACLLLNALAAALVCFGGRRMRVVGGVVAALAVVAIVEVAVLGPGRPPRGVVLGLEVAMRAEPDAQLAARMKMRAGVMVQVLGRGSSGWTKIRAAGLTGWVESDQVAVVD